MAFEDPEMEGRYGAARRFIFWDGMDAGARIAA